MNPVLLVNAFLAFANRLKFKNLFFLTLGLFVFDMLIPDFIPMVDEIILGLLTLVLANMKKNERLPDDDGDVIEGEIVDEDKDK